jgi:hypothetical protein
LTNPAATAEPTAAELQDLVCAVAESVRTAVAAHLVGEHADLRIAAVDAGLTMAVGDWITANSRACGADEPRAFAAWSYRLRDYLIARAADDQAATRH